MNYTKDQQAAAAMFLAWIDDPDEKYMVIQGDAGTGKTTGMKHCLRSLEAKRRLLKAVADKDHITMWEVVLLATTNQATNVLADLSGAPSATVHSHFALVPKHDYSTGETKFIPGNNTVERYQELIVIDESSFLDDKLLDIIDQYTPDCKVLLVGDYWQLAPVKAVKCAMQTVKTKYKAILSEVVRHNGAIADAGAHFKNLIPTQLFTPYTTTDSSIELCDGAAFRTHIDRVFKNPDYTPSDGRILAWTNDRVNQFNTLIREIRGMDPLIQEGELVLTNKPIVGKEGTFATTDSFVTMGAPKPFEIERVRGRLVQFGGNGQRTFERFLPDNQKDATTLLKKLAKKKQWPMYFRIKEEWLDLRSAFASTVHKSQGSSFDEVFIDLSDISKCNIHSDVARLLYVAITRASKKIYLYGNLPAKYGGIFDGLQPPVEESADTGTEILA